ncbi:MAG: rod shape-determining protein MreC [Candidatus Omnitrophica bacterium]|nr:rod shape-determining protein MreC [Candidatus Omnitrophota bacterium]MBU4303362.1 rod shape-determining protein MreC [Candidatus Omnitrophota bacterium]MBU4467574.1 rod shape-determining protein MreC [Candidatus Omnitrophota bacterium]MCG2707233.1 rod shape-determining protein MreC [Candidatus Omnitrophota bacterium]
MFKSSRKNIINFILLAGSLVLVFNFLSCFKNPTQKIFKPHLSFISLIKRELSGIVFYHRNMARAEGLQNDIDLLRWRLFDLREIAQENDRLKNLFNFKRKSSLRLVAARVIGRAVDSWSSSVIINKGRYNGIKSKMVVISSQGLVGSIVETTDDTSKVLLINDPNQGISSIVQRSRQEGLVNGTLGTNLIMRYLPDDAQIMVGDIIITSELSQMYPKGLLLGRVVNIGREFSGLNRYALVKPAVDLANIEEVLVIIP